MWDQWFVEEFSFLGIHFQNWMLVAAGIVLVAILAAWLQRRTR
jgi:LPXTG-motif cell wall-anchored protein